MRTGRTVARVVLWAHRRLSPYGGTRFLLLCALEGRKSGRVTVGESRLPVAGVLRTIRAAGVVEAAVMWPQLTEEELSVLEQLSADIPAEERPEVDVLRDDLVDAFRAASLSGGLPDRLADCVLKVLADHAVVEGDGNG